MSRIQLLSQPVLDFFAGGQSFFNTSAYPGSGTNNSIAGLVTFAGTIGTLLYEVWGDSTVQRSGGGHDENYGRALATLVGCRGQMVPCNTTSIFNYTAGGLRSRRRNNASTACGLRNDIGVNTPGYPVADKALGFQIPVPGAIAGASTWSGAQAAYLAGTTLTVAVLIGDVMAGAGTLTVADTSAFLAGTSRLKIDDEIFKYTGKTATTFTGVTRADLSPGGSAAQAHGVGSVVGQCDNGAALSGMLALDDHPLGSGGTYKCSLFYMRITASATPGARASLEFLQQDAFTNTTGASALGDYKEGVASWGGANTSLALSPTPQVVSTGARGTIGVLDSPATSSVDNTTTTKGATLAFGTAQNNGNGLGPSGPAAYMMLGVFETSRPVGVVQGLGVSKGGKTLNQLLKTLRAYDVTNSVCEYDAGLLGRFTLYLDSTNGPSGSGRGGNGILGYCKVVCTGSNEASGSTTETALVDPTESWSIARQTTINGGTAVSSSSTTAITLASVTGIPTTGGHVLITDADGVSNPERIIYTGVSGSTLTGITRGAYGTVPVAHASGSVVYQGFNIQDPFGLAADLVFDYNLTKAKWVAAGGSLSRFWYKWVRPLPQSTTSTVVADATAASGAAQIEYKFGRYLDIVTKYLGGRQGVIIVDSSAVLPATETVTYHMGVSTADLIHMADATYFRFWSRVFASSFR